ncbi:MAG: hypothetical protein U0326_32025 [Polyangiales bacterium]
MATHKLPTIASIAPPPAKPLSSTTKIALEELAAWRDAHPALTPLDHATFDARYPLDAREALAHLTKAPGTLGDARKLLRTLHPAPGAKPLGDLGISPIIMALLIEHTRRLAVAIEEIKHGTNSDGEVKIETARVAVNLAYRTTKSKVEAAAGRNEAWKAHIKKHLDSRSHNELDPDGARLRRLVDAIEAWLGGADATIKHSLAIEGVTAETAVTCAKAVTDLEAAKTLAVGAKVGDHDSAEVNRIEGAVLLLMLAVSRAVSEARAAGKTQLVLTPGAATRRVLAPNARARAKKAATDGAPTPPDANHTASAKVKKARRKKR